MIHQRSHQALAELCLWILPTEQEPVKRGKIFRIQHDLSKIVGNFMITHLPMTDGIENNEIPVIYLIQEEVGCGFTRWSNITICPETFLKPSHFPKQLQPLLKNVVHTTIPTKHSHCIISKCYTLMQVVWTSYQQYMYLHIIWIKNAMTTFFVEKIA